MTHGGAHSTPALVVEIYTTIAGLYITNVREKKRSRHWNQECISYLLNQSVRTTV